MKYKLFKIRFSWRINGKRVFKYFADKKENSSFKRQIKNEKIKISMTTKYDPYENAIAERVNGILKDEFEISDPRLTKSEARKNLNHAIRIYNCKRPHLSCNYLFPQQAHRYGKYKLKKWTKLGFSKN